MLHLDRNRDLMIEGLELVVLHPEGIGGEIVEVRDRLVHDEFGCGKLVHFEEFLHDGNVPIVDMAVRNYVHQFACFQACNL